MTINVVKLYNEFDKDTLFQYRVRSVHFYIPNRQMDAEKRNLKTAVEKC